MNKVNVVENNLDLNRLFELASKKYKNLEVVLKDRQTIAKDTVKIVLSIPEVFHFEAGQYIWLILEYLNYPDDRDRRGMSIMSSPSQFNELSVAYRTSESGFKKTLMELPLGSKILINGPRGSFVLPEEERPVVMIAGGIGIAPFMSMLTDLYETKSARRIYIVSLNSGKERRIFGDELQALSKNNPAVTLEEYFDKKFGSEDVKRIKLEMPGAFWYVAGPQNMITGVTDLLLQNQILEDQIVYDEFHKVSETDEAFSKSLSSTEHNEIFKLAVDSSVNHVIITDVEGRIVYANSAAEKTTGYSVAEMDCNTPRLWGGLMSRDEYYKLWKVIRIDKKPYTGDFINIKKNGNVYVAHAQISPIFDENHQLVGFIGMEEDITSAIRLESELQSKIKEYEQLNNLTVERELRMIALKKALAESRIKLDKQSGKADSP